MKLLKGSSEKPAKAAKEPKPAKAKKEPKPPKAAKVKAPKPVKVRRAKVYGQGWGKASQTTIFRLCAIIDAVSFGVLLMAMLFATNTNAMAGDPLHDGTLQALQMGWAIVVTLAFVGVIISSARMMQATLE